MGSYPKPRRRLLSELFDLAASYRERRNVLKRLSGKKNGQLSKLLEDLYKEITAKEEECRRAGIEQKELDAILHYWRLSHKKK